MVIPWNIFDISVKQYFNNHVVSVNIYLICNKNVHIS